MSQCARMGNKPRATTAAYHPYLRVNLLSGFSIQYVWNRVLEVALAVQADSGRCAWREVGGMYEWATLGQTPTFNQDPSAWQITDPASSAERS